MSRVQELLNLGNNGLALHCRQGHVSANVPHAWRHRWFDDKFAGSREVRADLMLRQILFRFQSRCWDRGKIAFSKGTQVDFVGVPLENIQAVQDPWDLLGPPKEGLMLGRMIRYRMDSDCFSVCPANIQVTPDLDARVIAASSKRAE